MAGGAKIPPQALTKAVMAVLREHQGREMISSSEMARRTGISSAQMGKILKGQKPVTLEELDLICSTLGVRLTEVTAEAEKRVRRSTGTVIPFRPGNSQMPDTAVADDPGEEDEE